MRAGNGELADCGRCSCGGDEAKPSSSPNGEGPGNVPPKLKGLGCDSASVEFSGATVVKCRLNDGLDKEGFPRLLLY